MTLDTSHVVLVTGASSGMGKDFALRLIAEGYVVYAGARRTERMGEIEVAGGRPIALDVTDDTSMVNAVARIVNEQGRIDVLINNAGYGQFGALEDVPIDEGRRQLETNLFGPVRLAQLCLPHMRAQKSGKIVNISSVGGKFATPLGGWYHASKFALEAVSDALRNEVRQFGVHVVVIEPGAVASEWSTIAADEAKRYSGDGPYAAMVSKFRAWQADADRVEPAPSVISDLIVQALKADEPETRYVGGGSAEQLLAMRRQLSDRQFDDLVMTTFK